MIAFWILPFIGCGVFLVGCMAVAYKQHLAELERQQEEEQQRQTSAGQNDDDDDIEKQNKIEAVKNRLVLQEWKDVMSDDEQQQQELTKSPSSGRTRSSLDVSYHAGTAIPSDTDTETTASTEAQDDDHGDTCGICLTSFEHNDLVGSSTNSSCCHYFHKDCITEWLTKHDECPFCRETFLVIGDEEEEVETAAEQDPEQTLSTGDHGSEIDNQQLQDTSDAEMSVEV